MNDRTLVKLRCNKEMLDIRTVSWTRKSPYSFSILRSELQQLEQRPQNRLISGDCGSFAVLRLTQRPGDMKMLEIRFTWLQEIGAGKVHGWQENIRLPYPSQLSGGMLQRATMAILIGLSPRYIFADEPTSALDEENKEYLIQVLMRMKQQAAILFVSHDDAAIRTLCDDLLVMQSGIIVEYGTTADLFAAPHKEWTKEFVRLAMVEEGGGWTWQKSKSEM